MIYLYTQGGNPLSPIFIFDAELSEKRSDEYEVTEFAVESNATVSDFIWVKPKVYSISGRVTSSPFGEAYSLERLQRVHRALVDAADRRQIVTLVTQTWVDDAIIKTVEATQGVEEGESLQIEITLQTILRPTVETVRIDPSRLRNRRKSSRGMTAREFVAASRLEDARTALARGSGPQQTITATAQPTFQVSP